MKIAVDCTGRMLGNEGGRTYVEYLLGLWRQAYPGEVHAVFSHGEVLPEFRGRDHVTELSSSYTRVPPHRLWDLHLGLRGFAARERPDVFYFPGNVMSAALPAGMPSVVAIRATIHYHYPAQFSRARVAYLRFATRHAVREAHRIIVPSAATADDLMRFARAARSKIVVIPHGIDLQRFSPSECEEIESQRFLFVSRPYDYKGLLTAMRAMRAVNHADIAVRLAVADGGVPAAQRDALAREAQRLGVGEAVEFLGRVDHSELVRLYRTSSALVVPTSYESFGNPFLEAAACGCQVVTGHGHGIDATIGPVAEQVDPYDHRALAGAMTRMINLDERERAERAGRLREWAEGFSWERTLEETRAVILETVA